MPVTRREFLKFTGMNLATLALPRDGPWEGELLDPWPSISLGEVPISIARILDIAPRIMIGMDGILYLRNAAGRLGGRAPQAYTQWNREQRRRVDRLNQNLPWGIVLHWYGDKENFDRTVRGYLRGFDSLREIDEEQIRTSAHFVVGDEAPLPEGRAREDAIGLLQTQSPDKDGTPFLASHLRPLDYAGHKLEKKQYFVRALYQLARQEPAAHSLLQDLYDGPQGDPNLRTVAIEIAGWDFENPVHAPSEQKIANVVALVWALMKRYSIPASSLLGHHEIQLNKADPGKKFMSLVRYLIGVKALVEGDEWMKCLVFGQFLANDGDRKEAVHRYFQFTRSYLVMIATPRRVYEWEARSKHWYLYESLFGQAGRLAIARQVFSPLDTSVRSPDFGFLHPENHEGVDFSTDELRRPAVRSASTAVNLIATGNCLYRGRLPGPHHGDMAIFRHRQADGAEILSVFEHLDEVGEIQAGNKYPAGYPVGRIAKTPGQGDPFLHFALAYGATWETDLQRRPSIPLNAGLNWIQDRYLDPVEYLFKG